MNDSNNTPAYDTDMQRVGVSKAASDVDLDESRNKRLETQELHARNHADSDKAASDALVAENQRLRVALERAIEERDQLTATMARDREVLVATVDNLKAAVENGRQELATVQETLKAAMAEIAALKQGQPAATADAAVLMLPAPPTQPASKPARQAKPTARTYAAVAGSPPKHANSAARSQGPVHFQPSTNRGPSAFDQLPAEEVQRRLDEHQRMHNVVIFGVRACPLTQTATVTTQQLDGILIPQGARIRRLSRSRTNDVAGPVLVTCRAPQQAYDLIHSINRSTLDNGLRARVDLSPDERTAKAARRRMNEAFDELVIKARLRYEWRGPRRTELWVQWQGPNGMEWHHVAPGPPVGPAAAPGTTTQA